MLRYKTKTRPGLVALYDIRPGNGAGQFLQPQIPHGAPVVEDIEAYGASFHSRKVRLILCLAQIVFQIQITLKNVIEIQNTF